MIDQQQLQRLVDGELSFEELKRLLIDIDSASDSMDTGQNNAWRSVAGAFIENQLVRTQFSVDERAEAGLVGLDDDQSATVPAKKNGSSFGATRWLSLAALLMLAMTVGVVLTEQSPESFQATPLESSQASSPTNPALADQHYKQELLSSKPAVDGNRWDPRPAVYRMQVQDPSGNQYLDSEVPLYSGHRADASKWLQEVDLPKSIYQRAEASGYHVEQDVRFLTGKLRDGGTFVIPVSKFSFSPEQ